MKIILESTDRRVWLESGGGMIPGRIWEGHTDSGIYVQCVITRIAAPSNLDLSQFNRELEECRPPSRTDVLPLRMVI